MDDREAPHCAPRLHKFCPILWYLSDLRGCYQKYREILVGELDCVQRPRRKTHRISEGCSFSCCCFETRPVRLLIFTVDKKKKVFSYISSDSQKRTQHCLSNKNKEKTRLESSQDDAISEFSFVFFLTAVGRNSIVSFSCLRSSLLSFFPWCFFSNVNCCSPFKSMT